MAGGTCRAIGLGGGKIVVTSVEPEGLDSLIGPDTAVVDGPDLTVMPAFDDAREHLMEASRNTLAIPVQEARSISDFTDPVPAAARRG